VVVDLGGRGVDAHDPLVALGVPILRRVLDQVVADREHEVGDVESGHLVVAGLEADRAEGVGVVRVQEALAHEGLRHRHPGPGRELPQRIPGHAPHHPVAGENDGQWSAESSKAAARSRSDSAGRGWTTLVRGSGDADSGAVAAMTSSGSSRCVAPGFSDSATLNALRTASGMMPGPRRGRSTS